MANFEKIRQLDKLSKEQNFGCQENQISELETKLNLSLPQKLRDYYLELGINESINYSHNRLLKPDNEVGFSDDRYLVFYEENQASVYWGIKEEETDELLAEYGIYDWEHNEEPKFEFALTRQILIEGKDEYYQITIRMVFDPSSFEGVESDGFWSMDYDDLSTWRAEVEQTKGFAKAKETELLKHEISIDET